MKTLPTFFRTDFSQAAPFLETLQVGPLSADEAVSIAALLLSADSSESNGQWTAEDNGSLFSVALSSVIYAGANNTDLPTHPLFKHVVGVSLPNDVDGEARRLYMHYNLPE